MKYGLIIWGESKATDFKKKKKTIRMIYNKQK